MNAYPEGQLRKLHTRKALTTRPLAHGGKTVTVLEKGDVVMVIETRGPRVEGAIVSVPVLTRAGFGWMYMTGDEPVLQ